MRRKTLPLASFAILCGSVGCTQSREAHYAYRDGNYGVVKIANDTKSSRRQAQKLMAQHFPDGYEIIREEEIETGSRKADQRSKRNTSIKPGAGMSQFMVGMGDSSAESESTFVDEVKLHEVRILYRNRKAQGQAGFASVASITPEMYNDPNRKFHDAAEEKLIAKADAAGPKADAGVKPASKAD